MADITLKGNPIKTIGELPENGERAPDFRLVKTDLSDATLTDYSGKKVILNIFPSIDTDVCAAAARNFNEKAASRDDVVVLGISADLPFAHKRFCEAEGLENVVPLSCFRNLDFGRDYGVTITTGPLTGLLARAVVIVDENGKVKYTEQVPEITREPDYEAALNAL